MGMYVEFLVVPIDISDVIHLKTLIYRWEIVFLRVARLANLMLLSVTLDLLSVFFLKSNFP